jgi:hypothetical protein
MMIVLSFPSSKVIASQGDLEMKFSMVGLVEAGDSA